MRLDEPRGEGGATRPWQRVARGRGSHPRTRARPGGSSAPTTRGCLQRLHVVWMKESESSMRSGRKLDQSQPRRTVAASGAPDGERADRKARNRRRRYSKAKRGSAIHPFAFRGEPLIAKRGRGTRAWPGPTKEHGRCRASGPQCVPAASPNLRSCPRRRASRCAFHTNKRTGSLPRGRAEEEYAPQCDPL
jgi:hypothetical protein